MPPVTLSIGKTRGLQQCSSPRGVFTCLALDHRQNLRRALNPQDPAAVSDVQLSAFKVAVCAALAQQATAVLLDPEYGAAQAVAADAIPGGCGLVVALESTGYGGESTARQSQILPDWSVEKAKRMGASMAKLLVYYHPASSAAPEIEDFTRRVAAECQAHDLALMLEPLSYSLDPAKKLPSDEKRRVVVETAHRLTAIPGVDLLKVEFPLDADDMDETRWADACAEINRSSRVPWILLSAAVSFDLYLRQVTIACRAGASGIAVGRAVWQEAVQMSAEARTGFLATTARQRLARLSALCQALARPWNEFYTAEAPLDWYRMY
ncbi:MAG: tagatose 1,6-diphosphate aldolase [Anaerolineae bacterium]|nr:tagatose 1,6-diphosphate aldolase [Anaerolineae bacterium]